METLHDYHIRRARDELDLAYRAGNRAASSAHLQLSALHMSRMRTLAAPHGSDRIPAEARMAVPV